MKCYANKSHKLKNPVWSQWDQQFITSVPIQCGKCAGCIQRKIAEWTFRLNNEREYAACTYFVTLTYDPYHVPINKFGKMDLCKKDVQQFFKNLRHAQKRKKDYGILENHFYNTDLKKEQIKYYIVGEYGTKKSRPHYHAIIFNASKDYIDKCWYQGTSDIQVPRSSSAVGYTIKYLSKRIFGITPPLREKEFALMSKGIGEHYIDKMKNFHKKNPEILFTSDIENSRVPMSKYYRNKLFTEQEREMQIPTVKKEIEKQWFKEIIKHGSEENASLRREYSKKQFEKKFISRAKPRKDL